MRAFVRRVAVLSLLILPVLVLVSLPGGGCPPDNMGQPDPDDMEPDDMEPDDSEIELTAPARELTAWEMVTAGIGEDGTVSKEIALQAFALTMGDLPGVTPPVADEIGTDLGCAAVSWISRYADELTDEQLAAVEAVLAPSGSAAAQSSRPLGIFGDHSCTINNATVSEDDEDAAPYRPWLEQELSRLEQVFGKSLGLPIYLTLGVGKTASKTLAWTSPQAENCGTETATSFRIELITNREAINDEAKVRQVLTHELVHCFQATWLPATDSLLQPPWLAEGYADFVSYQLHPNVERESVEEYLQTSLAPLYTREYDAAGFYFHLFSVGGDVIGRYEAAFKLKNNSGAFAHLIGPSGESFDETWASALANDPSRGDAWYMPEAAAFEETSLLQGVLPNSKQSTANPGEAGTRIAHIDFQADVIRFQVTGGMHGRIGWDGAEDVLIADLNGQVLCNIPGGCDCPAGTTGSPPQTPIPSSSAIVTAAGTTGPTTLVISGVSLDEYCEDESEPEPTPAEGVDPCIVGTWTSSEWTLPGPLPDLDGLGGDGAVVSINSSGNATWNFENMQPITVINDQIDVTTEMYSRGTATGRIMASNGTWDVSETNLSNMEGFAIDNILGQYPLSGGPGLFVLLQDGGYTCSGSNLSYTTTDPVDGSTISVILNK